MPKIADPTFVQQNYCIIRAAGSLLSCLKLFLGRSEAPAFPKCHPIMWHNKEENALDCILFKCKGWDSKNSKQKDKI